MVVLAVVVIVLVSVLGSSSGKATAADNPWVKPFTDTAVTTALQHVPVSELDAAGDASALGTVSTKKPSDTGLIALTGPKLTANGKPELIFLGSEYCPYCAATRWPFIIALSRFGSFTGLQLTKSSPLDIYRLTPTFSFAKAHYTSRYITLNTTEELSNHCPLKDVVKNTEYSSIPSSYYPSKWACNNDDYIPIQAPSKKVADLADEYDTTAYFGEDGAGGIPFIDFGGLYAEDGALYDPAALHGLSWEKVLKTFTVPTEGVGEVVLSVANRYTALICNMTGQKPGSVCKSSVIQAAEKALK